MLLCLWVCMSPGYECYAIGDYQRRQYCSAKVHLYSATGQKNWCSL